METSLRGAFGDTYVHPTQQVVVAIQSAWPSDADIETFALIRAAVRALRPDRDWHNRSTRLIETD